MKLLLTLFFVHFCVINCYIIDPGPVVKASQAKTSTTRRSMYVIQNLWSLFKNKGEIWPKPFQPSDLKFEVEGESCDILNDAIVRYKHIIKRMLKLDLNVEERKYNSKEIQHTFSELRYNSHFSGSIHGITINLKNVCEDKPHPEMTEDYTLEISNTSAHLASDSVWGILRGLESFSQLLVVLPDRTALRVNVTSIYDKPRYAFRGLLVDTSRHFINVFTLKQIIDGMAYNKLNVFHWHIVDDHSFPYESKTFPELSREGAYTQSMVYSQSQVQEIIEYARLRGIRTLAEFDTPGHTRSWGISHPEILTACEGVHAGKLGPIDPTKKESYEFMRKLLAEIVEVFPDEYVHLGGDEVGFECWETSSKIKDFMKRHNLTTYAALEEFYIQKVVNMVEKSSRKSIVWQEVFQNGVRLANGTVVHVWTGSRSSLLRSITKAGYQAILSSCWYLSVLASGGDWQKFYACEPNDFPGNQRQKSLLIGGEACMWSENVDNTNILQRIFPRVSAVAEKLWSQENVNDVIDAQKRLEEHSCRMNKRGIPAQPPNGPGFCL